MKIVGNYLFEQRVIALRKEVIAIAEQRGADSAEFIAALADAVGIAAAILDQRDGRRTLTDRLDSFTGRVQDTYARVREQMAGAEQT